MDYTYNDLKEAYKQLGVERGKVVLVKTDLRYLGAFEDPGRKATLDAHFNALADLVDLNAGTIVVSTASWSLCNTENPFDPDKTPSEMGVLTEFIRQKKESVRSFHPFASHTAIGRHAGEICRDVSRHSYGPETPKARMIDLDTMYISIGLHPSATASVVHHVEMIMGVPYRYTKEFVHPVVREGRVRSEPFYVFVVYRNCDTRRGPYLKIFEHFYKSGYKVKEANVGRGMVYSYSMTDFCESTIDLFKRDIYACLESPPENRPYRI